MIALYSLLLVRFVPDSDGNPVGKFPEDNSYWVLPDYREEHAVDIKTMQLPGLYLVGLTRASNGGNARLCRILSDMIDMTPAEALAGKMELINQHFLDPMKKDITNQLQRWGVSSFESEGNIGGFTYQMCARKVADKGRIRRVRYCTGKVDVTLQRLPWPLTQTVSFVVDNVTYDGDMINHVVQERQFFASAS